VGALPSRLKKRGTVLGRGRQRLYVQFDGERWPVGIRPQTVQVIGGNDGR
jgi:hypothetical protein